MTDIRENLSLDFVILDHAKGLDAPRYETDGAAGFDVRAAIDEGSPLILEPLSRALVPTGLKFALPKGFEAQVRPRSGLAAKHGVTVLNTPGTIDADYRGEIKVILVNLSDQQFEISRGMRIAQIIVAQVNQPTFNFVSQLDMTERNDGGFGSTGYK